MKNIYKKIILNDSGAFGAHTDDDSYYGSIAIYYRLASVVLGVLAALLVVIFLIVGYKELTYNNIHYFIKDFNSVIDSDLFDADVIEYGTGENRKYYSYRGGVVASEKYAVSVYSATGKKTATFNNEFLSPSVSVSSKYILVYDSEGKSFSICNSFAQLYSETLDYPIYSAYINDLGEALIHSATAEYKSVLYHYDSAFDKIAAYYFTDYVVCSTISDGGNYIICVTMDADQAKYTCRLEVYKRGEEKAHAQYVLNDCVPLKCEMLGNDCCLVTDKGCFVFNLNGKGYSEVLFDEKDRLLLCEGDQNGMAMVVDNSDTYYMVYVSSKGDNIKIELTALPIDFDVSDDSIYVLYDGAVGEYELQNKTYVQYTYECAPGANDILSTAGGVYLCYGSRAVYFEY